MTQDIRTIIREELRPLREDIKRTNNLLDGGASPQNGIIVKVDRLEQTGKTHKFWLRTVAVMFVTSIAASIKAIFQ